MEYKFRFIWNFLRVNDFAAYISFLFDWYPCISRRYPVIRRDSIGLRKVNLELA